MTATIGIDARKLADFGIGTHVRGLIDGLVRSRAEARFVLFARGAELPELGRLPPNFAAVRADVRGYSARELLTFGRALRRQRLDLFHATHYVLPLELPCPAVATVHDLIHLLFPDLLPGRLARLYARLVLGRTARVARRLVAVSETTRTDLVRLLGVPAERIRVVPNGVEPRFLAPLERQAVAAALAPVGIAPPYLLFLGNPKPHKNLDRLLAAFARLDPATTPPLLLAGARPRERAELEVEVRARGLAGRARCLGHLPADLLPALFQGAEILLFPSLYEGFGLPVLEAMASGTAVVCSRTPALAELVGEAAELVDPESVDDLARGISLCLGDGDRRRVLAARGRERARTFTWERTARLALDTWSEVLGRPIPTAPEAP